MIMPRNAIDTIMASLTEGQVIDAWQDIREMIVEDAGPLDGLEFLTIEQATEVWQLLQAMKNEPYEGREDYTSICLSLSLCPIHEHDYAICFDDEYPECAQVRVIHPGHDT